MLVWNGLIAHARRAPESAAPEARKDEAEIAPAGEVESRAPGHQRLAAKTWARVARPG
jgi:hypothetical protein